MESTQQKNLTFSELIEALKKASGGKTISSGQIKRLVTRGKLIRIVPPGGVQGTYTAESVAAYAQELREFYGVEEGE